jgi:long-subunit acyl-CoA synthetase (AMP-forming)
MYIMTQDHKRLINSEYIGQIYVVEDNGKTGLYIVLDDDEMLLGAYEKAEHADDALKFVGVCLVDKDSQGKIIQLPSLKDMELKDKMVGADKPRDFAELMEKVLGGEALNTARILTLTSALS